MRFVSAFKSLILLPSTAMIVGYNSRLISYKTVLYILTAKIIIFRQNDK